MDQGTRERARAIGRASVRTLAPARKVTIALPRRPWTDAEALGVGLVAAGAIVLFVAALERETRA